jgi:hypothetical protein
MGRSLLGLGRILLRTAPQLVAWFAAGQLVSAAVLTIAAPLGPTQSPLLALLLIPIGVIAKLVSYIGMFLVLRPELPVFTRLAGRPERFGSFRETAADFLELLLASIVPFFVLYGLIGGVDADLEAYQQESFRYAFGQAHESRNIADDPTLLIATIVIAFLLRQILRRFGERLPRWVAIPSVYLEATWVFVAVTGITALFGGLVAWVQDRQIVAWVLDARATLRGLWSGFRVAIDGIEGATPIAVQLILLPLAWLLIAGVILTRALAEAEKERVVPKRLEVRARLRLSRLPRPIQRQLRVMRGDWEESFRPLVVTGRMILRSGIRNLALFAACYALLFALDQWVSRAAVLAIGAHDERFWITWAPVVSFVINLVFEPVRIALLAAGFDAVLERWSYSKAKRRMRTVGSDDLPPSILISTSA